MRKVLFATSRYPMYQMRLLILSLVLLSTVAYSQETASIVGTVTDQTGAAVPGAKVTITNMDTGIVRSSTSNSTGSYNAAELAVGKYKVRVEAAGFKAFEQVGVTLNVGDTVRADAPLQVGETKESVTVEANAIAVQAETNEVSQTITDREITDLATSATSSSSRLWCPAPQPGFRILTPQWLKPRTGPSSSTVSGPTTTTGLSTVEKPMTGAVAALCSFPRPRMRSRNSRC